MKDTDPVKKAIYQELYRAFLQPLRDIEGVCYPDYLQTSDDDSDDGEDGEDDYF
jgi:hypothetical protein